MSVINNVLKDLETRESSFAPIEFPALENRAERRPALRSLILILLVMVAGSAGGWYYWQHGVPVDSVKWTQSLFGIQTAEEPLQASGSEQAAVAEPIVLNEAATIAVVTEVTPEPAIAEVTVQSESVTQTTTAAENTESVETAPTEQELRNQIIGLQMREADSEMHLEFALREKVIAYVTERSENGFSYHLRDIENQIVAPVLRDNRWLQSLSIANADNGVDVHFETVAGILVETRQQQGEDEQIWRISFRQPEPVTQKVEIKAEPAAVVHQASSAEVTETKAVVEAPQQEVVVAKSDVAESKAVVEASGHETVVAESVVKTADSSTVTPAQEPEEVKLDIRTTNPNATEVSRLNYALELINTGRHAEAEKLLQSLLSGPEDHAARTHLMAIYGHQNRHDRLARLAQNSLARYPGDEVFLTEYARSRYQTRAYRIALELLSGITRFNADQHALAAASHQRLENHERAIEHYRKALAIEAGNAKNWVGLGISQEHTADLEKALQSYRNAMKLGTLNERLLTFVEKRSKTLEQVLN